MRTRRSRPDGTTLDPFGRVLLPKAVRRRLGLRPGDGLALRVEGGSLVLRPDRPGGAWVVEDGVPVWTGRQPEGTGDVGAILRGLREARARRVLGRGGGKRR